MATTKDHFRFEITGDQAVSVASLSDSLKSLQSIYRSSLYGNAELRGQFEDDLYVGSVKEGSQIYELVSIAAQGVLPIVAEVNTAFALAENVKGLVDYFLRKSQAPKTIKPKDCTNAINVVMPAVVSDNSVAFGVVQGGIHIQNLIVSPSQANTIVENAFREKALLEAPETERYSSQTLRFVQANSVKTSTTGTTSPDKGIIPELSAKAQSVLFAEEIADQKAALLKNHNFYDTVFDVDVEVARLNGNVKAFVILRIEPKTD